jgi:hypothetical protein
MAFQPGVFATRYSESGEGPETDSSTFGLAICPISLCSVLERYPGLEVRTNADTYSISLLGASLSPVLRAHFDLNRFTYDFEDEDHVFRFVADYLSVGFGEFTPSNADALARIARDLELSALESSVLRYGRNLETMEAVRDANNEALEEAIWLQRMLRKVDSERVEIVAFEVARSVWFSSRAREFEFCENVVSICAGSVRRRIRAIVSVVCKIAESAGQAFFSEFFKRRLFRLLDSEHNFPLIIELNDAGLLSTSDLVNTIFAYWRLRCPRSTGCYHPVRNANSRMVWFLPELEAFHSVITSLFDTSNPLLDFWLTRTGISLSDEEIYSLKADNWKRFRTLRSLGRDTDPVSIAIECDDVLAFQTQVSQLMLDVDARVRPVAFRFDGATPNSADLRLPGKGSVLEAAAANSAVKIAKYLVMNGAKASRWAAIAAVSGGCPEILRLFDDHYSIFDPNFGSSTSPVRGLLPRPRPVIQACLDATVSGHQNELLRWILESKLADRGSPMTWFRGVVQQIFDSNNVEALLMFLDAGGDLAIWKPRFGPIAEQGHLTILKLLAEFGQQLGQQFWEQERETVNQREYAILSGIPSSADLQFCTRTRVELSPRRPGLAFATASGNIALVRTVLNLIPESGPRDFCIALGTAFSNGHRDVVEFLISQMDPTFLTSHIGLILTEGASTGTADIGQLLMPFMVEIDDIGECIVAATSARNIELAKLWISWQRERPRGVSLDRIARSGIETYDLEIVEFLGLANTESIRTIAEISCNIGYLDGVKYALGFLSDSERSDVAQKYIHGNGRWPSRDILAFCLRSDLGWRDRLITAIALHDGKFAESILSQHGSTDCLNFVTPRGTPLGFAASHGDLDIVEQLLSVREIDCMIRGVKGTSPFVLACRSHHASVYERLGSVCGEIIEEDEYQVNAGFFWASQSRHIDVAFELMPFFSRFSNLDPNFHIRSTSAFIFAASSRHYSLLQSLLQWPGIEVNDRDDWGWTGPNPRGFTAFSIALPRILRFTLLAFCSPLPLVMSDVSIKSQRIQRSIRFGVISTKPFSKA